MNYNGYDKYKNDAVYFLFWLIPTMTPESVPFQIRTYVYVKVGGTSYFLYTTVSCDHLSCHCNTELQNA